MFQRPIIGSLAVPAGGRVTRRKGLRRAAYATPLLTVAIASTLRVAAARLLGFRGAHDWPLREELFIVFLRALLEYGDIAVWRVFFQFVCPNPLKLPPGMRDAPAALAGSRSVWYELAPELLPAQPRGRVNMMFIHGGARRRRRSGAEMMAPGVSRGGRNVRCACALARLLRTSTKLHAPPLPRARRAQAARSLPGSRGSTRTPTSGGEGHAWGCLRAHARACGVPCGTLITYPWPSATGLCKGGPCAVWRPA
jgi:hypothetical protein